MTFTLTRATLVAMTERMEFWGVFEWTRENRYPLAAAIKTYRTKAGAERRCERAYREGENWVARPIQGEFVAVP